MSSAKPLRYIIALLILLYIWVVIVPSARNADGWNVFGLLLFLAFAIGLTLRNSS